MIVPSAHSSITALKSVTDTHTDISQIYITRISGPYGPFEILALARGIDDSWLASLA